MPQLLCYRLLTLGGLRLDRIDGDVPPHVQRKRLGLLVLLGVASGRAESREKVASLLWPDSDEERARQSLKQAVYALRQLLGTDALRTDRTTLSLNELIVACDAGAFERAFTSGDFGAAARLYTGSFLAGYHLADGEEMERWVEETRARLADRARTALRRAAAAEAVGDRDSAITLRSRLVELDPLNSADTIALMELRTTMGDCVGALRDGQQLQDRLYREMGLGPNAEVQSLTDKLRAYLVETTPAASFVELPAPAPTGDPQQAPVISPIARRGRPLVERRRQLVRAAAYVGATCLVLGVVEGRGAPASSQQPPISVLPVRLADGRDWRPGAATIVRFMNDVAVKAPGWAGAVEVSGVPAPVRPCGSVPQLYVFGDLRDAPRVSARLELRDSCRAGFVVAQADVAYPGDSRTDILARAALELVASRFEPQSRRVAHVAVQSSAPLAIESFLLGQEWFRRGQYDSSLVHFTRATQLDTLFALAYHWQSVAADWAGRPLQIEAGAQQAVRLKERLPVRDRMLAEGWYDLKFGRARDAERLFTSVATSYPDDAFAWLQLGEVLFHSSSVRGRKIQDAAAPFRRVLVLDTSSVPALHHLIRLAAMREDTLELDSLSDRVRRGVDPDSTELVAFRAFARHDPAEQRRTMADLARAAPEIVATATWRTAVFARNIDAAGQLATLLLADPRAAGHRQFALQKLAEFAVAHGQWQEAEAALSQAAAEDHDASLNLRAMLMLVPPLPHPDSAVDALRTELSSAIEPANSPARQYVTTRLYLLGVLADRRHDEATIAMLARRLATARDAFTRADSVLAPSYATALRGLAARWRGDTAAAIGALEAVPFDRYSDYRAGPLASQTYERLVLADLLRNTGRATEAVAWLQGIADGLETAWYPAAHRALARIAESTPDRSSAAREYQLFINAWRSCDEAGRPLREDAIRRNLRLLRGGSLVADRRNTTASSTQGHH